MPLRALEPESSASANFATSAKGAVTGTEAGRQGCSARTGVVYAIILGVSISGGRIQDAAEPPLFAPKAFVVGWKP